MTSPTPTPNRNFRARLALLLAVMLFVGMVVAHRYLSRVVHAAAFTPGNLVVYRVGDGSAALGSAATAVFLDEYTTSGGSPVQTINMPTTVNGSNKRLTASGTATTEGLLTRSVDGQYLLAAGYDAATGTASITTSNTNVVSRVLARVDSIGAIDTTTGMGDTGTPGNPRGAVSTNGSDMWLSTSGGGVKYIPFGAISTSTTQLSSSPTNTRALGISSGQLYVSASNGTFQGVSTIGTGTPTTGSQTTTQLTGFPTSGTHSNYQFAFANTSTLYVADDGSAASGGGIQKWTLSGGTWSLAYTLLNNGSTTTAVRGLVVDSSGANPVIYATTTGNALIRVTDTGSGSTATSLATAPTNTAFRGVAFVPQAVASPSPAATPNLTINDVSQSEGNSGTTNFIFTVSLDAAAGAGGVTFTVNTADGTATAADNDYVPIVNGSGSISAGNTATTITVQVKGDTTPEANETFFVNISNIVNATAGDTQGQGTINNDDVTLTKIHDIQGPGNASPLSGSVTTTGIVTGVRSTGYFIQEPDGTVDADPNTSEGIFVFTSSAPPAAAVLGNNVQVTGTVSEFIPSSDPFSPSQTELTSPTTTLLSSSNPLPAAHTITAAETTSPNAYDNLERFEGMRVTVSSMTAISGSQGTLTEAAATSVSTGIFYGTVTGVARPFREAGIELPDTVPTPYPSGSLPANVPRFDFNPERLRVNSKAFTGATTLDVVSGQVITGITGPLDYGFRTYTIDLDAAATPVVSGPSTFIAVPARTANELTIASFNMERFYDTTNDPNTSDVVLTSTAFDGRLNKASLAIRNVLLSPDVIGIEEMEAGPTGNETLVLQQVADKVNADANTPGDYVPYIQRGNDVGGINNAFLVRSSRITVFSVTQYNLNEMFTDPNTSSAGLLNDRPPLVLRGSIPNSGGGTLFFTVVTSHLRSLNSVDALDNTGAHTRVKKQKQAESLANLIHSLETNGDPNRVAPYDNNIVSLGDYNAFEFNDGYVDVVGAVLGNPAKADKVVQPNSVISTDMFLLQESTAEQRYSYSFDGDAQSLDHILANHSMRDRFSRLFHGRMDADYAELFRADFNRPERLSDHDPAVAYFDLSLLAPTAANGSVTGRIVDDGGAPVAGATVKLSGSQDQVTITDAQGNYRLDGIETNGFYTVTPARANYTFTPANRSFSLLGVHTDASFTASTNGDHADAIDTTEFFVRQQYLDFLDREPDPQGFNAWVNILNKCGPGDVSCDRTHVSESFFRSPEFQERGYLSIVSTQPRSDASPITQSSPRTSDA